MHLFCEVSKFCHFIASYPVLRERFSLFICLLVFQPVEIGYWHGRYIRVLEEQTTIFTSDLGFAFVKVEVLEKFLLKIFIYLENECYLRAINFIILFWSMANATCSINLMYYGTLREKEKQK
jgi:hypothetical protein